MDIIRPTRLKTGDLIGIVSPSAGLAGLVPRRFQRGIEAIREMGFEVIVGKNALKRIDYTAGTIEERVEDLHEMYVNPRVKAIITSIGGTSSHQLLDELDYDLIRKNPKILLGYSDITALQWAITVKTGVVTYLGPAILTQFGEFGGLVPYTKNYFEKTFMGDGQVGMIQASSNWIVENLLWDEDDNRPRVLVPNEGPKVLKQGIGEGKVFAGNMTTLLLLAGTPYWPNLDGAILCVEEDENESAAFVDRYFTHLRHMGVYQQIKGLLVGRFRSESEFYGEGGEEKLVRILQTATRGFDIPVVYNADFGHTDPMFILPNGIQARLETRQDCVKFSFLEPTIS